MCADEGKGPAVSKDLLHMEEMGGQTATNRAGDSHPHVCLFYVHFPLERPTSGPCVTNT